MKTILIPTDFSPVSDNAMHYGARLAQMLQAQVVLLSVYTIPVSINDMPVILISAEELRKGAEDGLARCQQELALSYPELTITTQSRLGDVVDGLQEVCSETQPYLVVMGTHSASGVEQVLFGSTTITAIRRAGFPVIAVPEGYKMEALKICVLATDLQQVEKVPAQLISDVITTLGAALHVVHVRGKEEKEAPADALLNRLESTRPTYHTVDDENVTHGLLQYIQSVHADLLIMLPHEHSWLENFFFKLHTKQVITKAPVPVLCISAPT